MSHPWFRVALVCLLALTDFIVYFYETAILGQPTKPVSYPAHIAGAISGTDFTQYFYSEAIKNVLYCYSTKFITFCKINPSSILIFCAFLPRKIRNFYS
jgi:hypothetical protein